MKTRPELLAFDARAQTSLYSYYALSDPLTVQGIIPEPSSLLLFGFGAFLISRLRRG